MNSSKILLVEDDPSVALSITLMLEKGGYSVVSTLSSGEEALAEIGEEKQDLVLLDIGLEGKLDGIQTAEKMMDCCRIPFIYLSAAADQQTLKRAKATGPAGYLIKPVDPIQLLVTVQIALQNDDTRKQLEKSEQRLKQKSEALKERIKEQKCLYAISRLAEDFNKPVSQTLQDIVSTIPSGWKYPEQTCARITLEEQTFSTDNFAKTGWALQQEIKGSNETAGQIEVCYLSDLPASDESPFLKEERKLLIAVSDILANYLGRKDLQDRLARTAAIVESTDDAIIGKTLDGTITDWNPGAERIYGYRADEAIGQSIDMLVPAREKYQYEMEDLLKKIGRGDHIDHLETRRVTKSGREIYVNLSISPILDSAGRIAGASAIARDITEKKLIQHKSEKQQQQLIQTAKMASLGTLVAGIAHEINNPVNLIMLQNSFFQKLWQDIKPVLSRDAASEPEKKYAGLTYADLDTRVDDHLSDIGFAAQRIAEIIDKLKDFSKPADMHPPDAVDVNRAVAIAADLSRKTVTKAAVELKLNLASGLPAVTGNPQNLEQVVLNLILNAMQSIDHDHGLIEIATGSDKSRKNVYITVSDNGRGIDPAIADTIFDPFVTSRQTEGGTGLGLSICYQMLKTHDAAISFKTRQGSGTTFTVTHPVSPAKKLAKILIADDEPAIRNPLKITLQRKNQYDVETAANGIEACIKLGSMKPDLLVLDVNMPDMDGYEVCRVIRSDREFENIRVFIISGYPDDERLESIRQLGFSDVYVKPLNMKKLKQKIDTLFA